MVISYSRKRVYIFLATVVFYLIVISLSVWTRIPSGPVVSIMPLAASIWAFGARVGLFVLILELTIRGILFSTQILPTGVPTVMVLTPMIFSDTTMFLAVAALRRSELRQAASEERLRVKNRELESALAEVKELRGMLPICAWCKCVRDIDGLWNKLESYLSKHSHATFSHGICPECLDRMEKEVSRLREEMSDEKTAQHVR